MSTWHSQRNMRWALLGVAAWMEAVDVVLGGGGPAFALARPPGHHATPTEAELAARAERIRASPAGQHYTEAQLARAACRELAAEHGPAAKTRTLTLCDKALYCEPNTGNADWESFLVGKTATWPNERSVQLMIAAGLAPAVI